MFTGIVEKTTQVTARDHQSITIGNPWPEQILNIGQSIALDGCCLTIVRKREQELYFEVSPETFLKTRFAQLETGELINVERAMGHQASFDGHMVTGHIDGLAKVENIQQLSDGHWEFWFEIAPEVLHWVVSKGSVAINGISLTVNDLVGARFSINIIPHTFEMTNMRTMEKGDAVNIEFDLIAKYVDRILELRLSQLREGGRL